MEEREDLEREDLERELRARWEAGDYAATIELALERYGSEVLGFLLAMLKDEDAAGDVFCQSAEDLWKGIEGFGWRASLRTWMYAIARNAARRYRRSPQNRASRRVPLSQISQVADGVRSRTLPFLRTEVKDRFAAIRESLDPEDQELLILRVNRELSWNEIAHILAEEPLSDAALKQASARARKRFSRVKETIRQRAVAAGLLNEGNSE